MPVLGAYSYSKGPRYLNPLLSGSRFPALVELHESQHDYLAFNNVIDHVGRLYAGALDMGNDELTGDDRDRISRLLEEIIRSTLDVHEIYATYVSFLIYYTQAPENAVEARGELAADYARWLSAGERAFGSVSLKRERNEKLAIYTAMTAVTVAALNLPIEPATVRLSRLDECTQFIHKNSPNSRLKRLFRAQAKRWFSTSLLGDPLQTLRYDGEEDVEDYGIRVQCAVFDKIRQRFPDLKFESKRDNPGFAKLRFDELVAGLAQKNYRFSTELKRGEQREEKSFTANMAPVGDSTLGLDESLRDLSYRRAIPEMLSAVIAACASQGFCLIGALGLRDPDHVALLGYCADSAGEIANAPPPFEVVEDSSFFLAALETVPLGTAILKIDELMLKTGPVLYEKFKKIHHPTFVMLRNNTPEHFLQYVVQPGTQTRASVFFMKLSTEYALAIGNIVGSKQYFVSPFTSNGCTVLMNELDRIEAADLLEDKSQIEASLPVPAVFVFNMLMQCYVGAVVSNSQLAHPGLPVLMEYVTSFISRAEIAQRIQDGGS